MSEQPSFTFHSIRADSQDFQQVLALRHAAYDRAEAGEVDPIDAYSLHFVAKTNNAIVGALRVTCRKDGPFESERAYPAWVFNEFGDGLCAASRMCVHPDLKGGSQIPFLLMDFGWPIILKMGIRIDVSKVRVDAIPYYLRKGYSFLRDSFFPFDKWNMLCGLIAYPAHPSVKSPLSVLFSDLVDPCDLTNSLHQNKFTREYRQFTANVEAYKDSCTSNGHVSEDSGIHR